MKIQIQRKKKQIDDLLKPVAMKGGEIMKENYFPGTPSRPPILDLPSPSLHLRSPSRPAIPEDKKESN